MTLLISLLISICLLFTVETEWLHIHLSQKRLTYTQQNDDLFYATEDALNLIVKSINQYSQCTILWNPDPNYYTQYPSSSACKITYKNLQFLFTIETFTLDKTTLYRATIRGENTQDSLHAPIFLQRVLQSQAPVSSWREF